MAGLGRRVWAADEILAADDLQNYIQDQVVFVYDSEAARTSGILSPTEGMMSYLKNTNLIYAFDGTNWVEIAPNVGTPGTYTKVTTDAKGRVSSGTTLSASDIPNLDSSKITTGGFDGSRITSGLVGDAFLTKTGQWQGQVVNNSPNQFGSLGLTGGISAGGGIASTGGAVSASGDLSAGGNVYGANTYNQTNTGRAMFVASNGLFGIGSSSRRFKENIVDAELDADAVLKIAVRKFNYKKSFDQAMPESIGVIAEELEALGLTDFLFYNEDGQVDGVAYEKLALAVLSVVQVQQSKLVELEARVSRLEK
jgi:hypothetical protein